MQKHCLRFPPSHHSRVALWKVCYLATWLELDLTFPNSKNSLLGIQEDMKAQTGAILMIYSGYIRFTIYYLSAICITCICHLILSP